MEATRWTVAILVAFALTAIGRAIHPLGPFVVFLVFAVAVLVVRVAIVRRSARTIARNKESR